MSHASLVGPVLSLLLLFQASQQVPPRDQPADSKKGTAIVRGRITAADTGSPIRSATISLRSSELKEGRSALSDAEGRYELKDLPAGRFTVSVSPSRFKPMYLGTSSMLAGPSRSRIVEVADGQVLKDVDFALLRAGAINGRVVDEFGEPLANVRMSLTAKVPGRGTTPAFGTGLPMSDDYGRFRIYGLEPGEYFVKAEATMPTTMVSPDEIRDDYVPTFYPSTTNAAEAPPVKLEVGQELTDIDIRMVRSRTFRLTGLVLDSQGRPAGGATLMLSLGTEGGGLRGIGGASKPDGTFEFSKLTPGDYVIVARPAGYGTETSEASRPVKITIAGADVENITLAMGPGVTLVGHVVTDNAAVPAFKPTGIRAMGWPIDRTTAGLGAMPSAAIGDDWTFEITGVRVPIVLRLSGRLPEGWRLRSVSYHDTDITDVATDFAENTAARGVEIVISNRGAKVEGVVVDDVGRPAPDRPVILFSTEESLWFQQSSRTRVATSDEQGRFKLEGLAGGSYLAVALEGTTRGLFTDRAFFEPLVRLATRVTLSEDEQKTLNLRIAKLEK